MSNNYNGAKFIHFRDTLGLTLKLNHSNGGATVAYKEVDGTVYVGIAHCNLKDSYNYAYGRAKSAGFMQQLIARPGLNGAICEGGLKYFCLSAEEYGNKNSGIVDAIIDIMEAEEFAPRRERKVAA